jgi:hypothetical protein
MVSAVARASPAMGDVVIGTNHDATRHEDRANQERDAAHHDMDKAREHTVAAHDQERRGDNDKDREGVRVEIGH